MGQHRQEAILRAAHCVAFNLQTLHSILSNIITYQLYIAFLFKFVCSICVIFSPLHAVAFRYDIFLVGTLAAYEGFNTKSDPSVRYTSRLTIDPLGHCQKAADYFGPNLIEGRTALALSQAFEVYGIHPVTRTNVKNVTFYVMSSNDEAGKAAGMSF